MGNCLVTKLKASVDNDSLRRFGYLRVERQDGGLNTPMIIVHSDHDVYPEDFIYGHNITYTQQPGSSGNAVVSWTDKSAWFDVKKENLSNFQYNMYNRGTAKLNIEDFNGCPVLNGLELTGIYNNGITGNVDKLHVPTLRRFSVDYNEGLTGTVNYIVNNMPNLEQLFIAGTSINGSANYIVQSPSALKLSNLRTVEFHSEYVTISGHTPTPITFSVSNVVICANLGCKVYIHESQIFWDTMTKAEFLEMYESLPTPPTFYPSV